MNTLWTFGDSQTFGHGCRPDGPLLEYYNNYKKEDDDIWPVLLGKKLNMNVINCGQCGVSNDFILDEMMRNFDNINEGDYVILGKTLHQRFDVKDYRTGKLFYVLGEYGQWDSEESNKYVEKYLKEICRNREELETLINFTIYFAQDDLYRNRQDFRFNFIKNRLINEKKISFYYDWMINDEFVLKNVERIITHTKGKCKDYHFSFYGHKQMTEYFYDVIQNIIHNGKRLI